VIHINYTLDQTLSIYASYRFQRPGSRRPVHNINFTYSHGYWQWPLPHGYRQQPPGTNRGYVNRARSPEFHAEQSWTPFEEHCRASPPLARALLLSLSPTSTRAEWRHRHRHRHPNPASKSNAWVLFLPLPSFLGPSLFPSTRSPHSASELSNCVPTTLHPGFWLLCNCRLISTPSLCLGNTGASSPLCAQFHESVSWLR
jgi:hypothetical protein